MASGYPRWADLGVDWPNSPASLINQSTYPPFFDCQENIYKLQRAYSKPREEWLDVASLGNVSGQIAADTALGGLMEEFYKSPSSTPTKWTLSEIEASIGESYVPNIVGDPPSAYDLWWRYKAMNLLNIFDATDYFNGSNFYSQAIGDARWNERWTHSKSSGASLSIVPGRGVKCSIPNNETVTISYKPMGSRIPEDFNIEVWVQPVYVNSETILTGLGFEIKIENYIFPSRLSVRGPDLSTGYTTLPYGNFFIIQMSSNYNESIEQYEYTLIIRQGVNIYTNTSTTRTNPGTFFSMTTRGISAPAAAYTWFHTINPFVIGVIPIQSW